MRGLSKKETLVAETANGPEEMMTVLGMLQVFYAADPDAADSRLRLTLRKFQRAVRADLDRQRILGRTPDLDETLARVGNLEAIEKAISTACLEGRNIEIGSLLGGQLS